MKLKAEQGGAQKREGVKITREQGARGVFLSEIGKLCHRIPRHPGVRRDPGETGARAPGAGCTLTAP